MYFVNSFSNTNYSNIKNNQFFISKYRKALSNIYYIIHDNKISMNLLSKVNYDSYEIPFNKKAIDLRKNIRNPLTLQHKKSSKFRHKFQIQTQKINTIRTRTPYWKIKIGPQVGYSPRAAIWKGAESSCFQTTEIVTEAHTAPNFNMPYSEKSLLWA